MLATMVITGAIAARYEKNWEANPAAGWACVVMIWLYIVNFAYGWGPCSWTLIAEIFPLSTRAKGTSIAASANWMNNFAVALMVPSMLKAISWRVLPFTTHSLVLTMFRGLYIFFAGWLLLSVFFIYFFVPETKGKTLEQMDAVFGYVHPQIPNEIANRDVRSTTSDEDLTELGRVQHEVGLLSLLHGVLPDSHREDPEAKVPSATESEVASDKS
jgi:Sugar (and other) transporter